MLEAEGVRTRAIGADEALARERREVARGVRAAHVEAHALDGGALEDVALVGVEALDAGGEDRLDARRQRALVGSHRDELLEEQRVALGAPHDPGGAGHVAHELERLVRAPAAPGR